MTRRDQQRLQDIQVDLDAIATHLQGGLSAGLERPLLTRIARDSETR